MYFVREKVCSCIDELSKHNLSIYYRYRGENPFRSFWLSANPVIKISICCDILFIPMSNFLVTISLLGKFDYKRTQKINPRQNL